MEKVKNTAEEKKQETDRLYIFIKSLFDRTDENMKGLVYYNGLVINIIHLMLCLCIYNITVLKIATVSLCVSYLSVNIIMICLIVKNKIQDCILKSVKLWLCILISFAVLCLLTISIFLDAEQSATTIKGLCLMIVLFWGIYRLIETLFATVFNNEHIPMFFASIVIYGILIAGILLDGGESRLAQVTFKVAIAVFYMLWISLFINDFLFMPSAEERKLTKIIKAVFCVLVIVVSFPFYVRYCGVGGEDFNIFVNVYAALVGGGLTLAGVAWTIKKSDDDKKEERRSQCIPYLTLDGQTITIEEQNNGAYSFDIRNGEKIKEESEDKKQYRFSPIRIKNVSNSIVIIAGVCIDNTEFLLKTKRMIEKENSKIFIFKGRYESTGDVKEVFLIAEDVLKNKYYLKCCCLMNLEENKFNTNAIDINNAGYKDLLQCEITGIELPIFKGTK